VRYLHHAPLGARGLAIQLLDDLATEHGFVADIQRERVCLFDDASHELVVECGTHPRTMEICTRDPAHGDLLEDLRMLGWEERST
jgi:hypothetical protein